MKIRYTSMLGAVMLAVVFASHSGAAQLEDLRKAAENGDATAQYKYADELAWLGIARTQALAEYEKAAAGGSVHAKIALASLKLAKMESGSKEEKDYLDKTCPALKPRIEKLEKQDEAETAYNLGDVYENGICVKKDEKKALEYFRKAAAAGNDKAQCLLAQRYLEMPDKADKALDLLKKAFKSGLPRAGILLAGCYYAGKGTEQSTAEADKVVKQMEEWANPYAWAMLGFGFYRGAFDFPKDPERGEKLLQLAASEGVEQAVKFLDKVGSRKGK